MKKFLSLFFTAILVFSLSSCNPKGYPVILGDTEISAPPERVITLSESSASAISAMGYGEYIVGAPIGFIEAEGSSAADIGSQYQVYNDYILALEPDLVITSFNLGDSFEKELAEAGIALITLNAPEQYEDLEEYYLNIAKIFEGEENCNEVYNTFITDLNSSFEEMKAQTSGVGKKVAVYIESGFLATGDTFSGQVLEKVGINNIAADRNNYMMSAADIVKANPDVIFCPEDTASSIMENEFFKDVTAVKNAAVYEVDVSSLLYAGKNMVPTLKEMTNYLSK